MGGYKTGGSGAKLQGACALRPGSETGNATWPRQKSCSS